MRRLEQALGPLQVLQPVRPEVHERQALKQVVRRERGRRLGDQDLLAVARRADPRGAVDVERTSWQEGPHARANPLLQTYPYDDDVAAY